MLKKSIFSPEAWISKNIVAGAIVGGVLGTFAAFLYTNYVAVILGIGNILTGTILGIFTGVGISNLFEFFKRDKTKDTDSYLNSSKLQLRKEQLDISKKLVKTGEVTMHKEVIKENKNIVVPITREELIIEKKVLDKEGSNKHTETIRIPISEEHIEVIKHPVIQENVAVYKHQIHETKHIKKTLKREKAQIKTIGDLQNLKKNDRITQ